MTARAAKKKPPPPFDKGWGWMIALGVFMCVFCMVGIAKSYGLIMMALLQEFKTDTAAATMPMSVCAFVYAFGAPTAILMAEHFGTKAVVIAGGIIGFIGFSLASFLVSMTYFTIIFGICYGLGNSCLYGNGLIIIGKYFRKRRSLAMGLALSGSSIGQFAMPPIIEYFLENYGLHGTMMLLGAIYFNCCVAGSLFRPFSQYGPEDITKPEAPPVDNAEDGEEALIQHNKEGNGEVKSANGTAFAADFEDEDGPFDDLQVKISKTGSALLLPAGSSNNLDSVSNIELSQEPPKPSFCASFRKILDPSVLKNYVSIFYLVVSFLCFFGYMNFVLFIPGIVREKGITKYYKALLISLCGIGDLIARIVVGILADKEYIARYKMKAVTCILCALDIFMFIFADSFAWLGVHSFLYGLFGGGYVCLMALVLVDFVGIQLMAKNLALVMLIQGIGAALGQPFLGFLRDEAKSYNIVIIICSVTLLIGAVLLLFYPVVRRLENARVARKSSSPSSA